MPPAEGTVGGRWSAAPADLPLPPGEVHLWRIPLAPPETALRRLEATLAPDERARAERFRFDVHRVRYVAGRGALRAILGRYLGVAPAAVSFGYAEHGKPRLDAAAAGAIRFNLSNAEDLALVALVRGREVGVDLENLRTIDDAEAIAGRFFSVPENEVFRCLPAGERDRAFLRCWTRKEAFVKAVGEGLSMPLDRFDVSFAPGEPARLLGTRPDAAEAARWRLWDVDAGPGWLAALMVERGEVEPVVRCWDWRE